MTHVPVGVMSIDVHAQVRFGCAVCCPRQVCTQVPRVSASSTSASPAPPVTAHVPVGVTSTVPQRHERFGLSGIADRQATVQSSLVPSVCEISSPAPPVSAQSAVVGPVAGSAAEVGRCARRRGWRRRCNRRLVGARIVGAHVHGRGRRCFRRTGDEREDSDDSSETRHFHAHRQSNAEATREKATFSRFMRFAYIGARAQSSEPGWLRDPASARTLRKRIRDAGERTIGKRTEASRCNRGRSTATSARRARCNARCRGSRSAPRASSC